MYNFVPRRNCQGKLSNTDESFVCIGVSNAEVSMYRVITKLCNRVSLGDKTVSLLQLTCLMLASKVTPLKT
jgi:hypothetical protein